MDVEFLSGKEKPAVRRTGCLLTGRRACHWCAVSNRKQSKSSTHCNRISGGPLTGRCGELGQIRSTSKNGLLRRGKALRVERI
jgi:hypothetical protein